MHHDTERAGGEVCGLRALSDNPGFELRSSGTSRDGDYGELMFLGPSIYRLPQGNILFNSCQRAWRGCLHLSECGNRGLAVCMHAQVLPTYSMCVARGDQRPLKV